MSQSRRSDDAARRSNASLRQGVEATRRGDDAAALAAYAAAVALNPDSATALTSYLRCAVRQHALDDVLPHLTKAADIAPDVVPTLIRAFMRTGRALDVAPALARLLARWPSTEGLTDLWSKCVTVLQREARTARVAGDLPRAARLLRALAVLGEDKDQVERDIQKLFVDRMRAVRGAEAQSAADLLGSVLAQDPDNVPVLRMLARHEAARGESAAALAAFGRLLALEPADHEAARRAFRLAQSMGDTSASLRFLHAMANSAQADDERAFVLKQALAVARVANKARDFQTNLAATAIALGIDPDNPAARASLDLGRRHLEAQARAVLRGRDAGAFQQMLPLLMTHLVDDVGLMTQVVRHLRGDATSEVLQIVQRIRDVHPTLVEAHATAATLANSLGLYSVAMDAAVHGLKLAPDHAGLQRILKALDGVLSRAKPSRRRAA